MTKKLIHSEGFIILIATIYLYSINDFKWWVFLLFILAPDLSMLAYLVSNRVGARIYNLFHTYTISISIIMIGAFLQQDITLMVGLIWTAHIGMDRLFGYGLKYKTAFKDTHIQKL